MAHLKVERDEYGAARLFLNGMDLTFELIADGVRIASTGADEHDEVVVDLRIALSRLDIGDHEDVDAALLVGSSLTRMATPASSYAPPAVTE